MLSAWEENGKEFLKKQKPPLPILLPMWPQWEDNRKSILHQKLALPILLPMRAQWEDNWKQNLRCKIWPFRFYFRCGHNGKIIRSTFLTKNLAFRFCFRCEHDGKIIGSKICSPFRFYFRCGRNWKLIGNQICTPLPILLPMQAEWEENWKFFLQHKQTWSSDSISNAGPMGRKSKMLQTRNQVTVTPTREA